MKRVLILSDSHGLQNEITEIKNRHKTDYMIHCGDSELDAAAPELDGFITVAGNCDFDNRLPLEEKLEIDQVAILIVHGHLYHVKRNLLTLSYRAKEKNAAVVCYGHTHIAGAEKIDGQLFINPGSILLPNNRSEKTYAILEWDQLGDAAVYFYTRNGEVVDELTFYTKLPG